MLTMTNGTWRSLIAYPGRLSKETARLLDSIAELVPIPKESDSRKDTIEEWLTGAGRAGILTSAEAAAVMAELDSKLYEPPDPYFRSLFLDGKVERLYEEGESDRIRESAAASKVNPTVRLSAGGGKSLAVIRPLTNREGVVVRSNFLVKGSTVRAEAPWRHVTRLRESWSGDTILNPRSLEVTSVPKRAGQFARARRAA